ncbi:unnamed protein product [Nesidiocoris tenuis]|uniref:Uncharacterized protein n=1 Tax=Nesidiocoris tenuis TaxID=355587 RepID=A0A6H5GJQ3_9HEMI|nr:unnamed protein product [Nesidiocoris tenuis]
MLMSADREWGQTRNRRLFCRAFNYLCNPHQGLQNNSAVNRWQQIQTFAFGSGFSIKKRNEILPTEISQTIEPIVRQHAVLPVGRRYGMRRCRTAGTRGDDGHTDEKKGVRLAEAHEGSGRSRTTRAVAAGRGGAGAGLLCSLVHPSYNIQGAPARGVVLAMLQCATCAPCDRLAAPWSSHDLPLAPVSSSSSPSSPFWLKTRTIAIFEGYNLASTRCTHFLPPLLLLDLYLL